MADIFVSYASEDRDRILLLVEALESQGWSVWWDRELITGTVNTSKTRDRFPWAYGATFFRSYERTKSTFFRCSPEISMRKVSRAPSSLSR